ncbi:MAG: hypothetical protein ACREKL_11905 [Chthoniobacterales bacterium]
MANDVFSGIWNNSFITDPVLGRAYAITLGNQLFQCDVITKQVFTPHSVTALGPLALGANGQLVALHDNASGGSDIDTMNPQTGTCTTLVPNALQSMNFDSFISDPSAGVGYVLISDTRLLNYDLATGRILGSPLIGFGTPLTLGANGKLVGMRDNSEGSSDLVTIDPKTGTTKTLVKNALTGYWMGTFTSNVALGIGYVLTVQNNLLQFDLVTGKILANTPVTEGRARETRKKIALQRMGPGPSNKIKPKPKPPYLVYYGRKKLIAHNRRITVRGEVMGKTKAVSYLVGLSGKYRRATGIDRWKVFTRVKRGRNFLTIFATGPGGDSRKIKLTIVSR